MTALRRYPRGLRGLGQDSGYNPLNTNLDLPWDYLPTTYYSGTGTTLEMAGVSPVTNVNVPGSGNITFAGGSPGGTGGTANPPPAAKPSACVTALGGGSTAQFICGSWLLLLGGVVVLLVATGRGRR